MKNIFTLALLLCLNYVAQSQTVAPPALASIRIADLKKDLYEMADAHYKGRSAGTLDELKSATWMAAKFRTLGIKPMGDDGTFFQFFSLWRNRVSDNTTISINNRALKLWSDVAVATPALKNIEAPIVYLGNAAAIDTNALDVKGKVVAVETSAGIINYSVSLPAWRYGRNMMLKFGNTLISKGAIAVIIIADETMETTWADAVSNFKRGTYDIDGGPNVQLTATVPVFWLHADSKNEISSNSAVLKADIVIDHFEYPSVNIIGKIAGTDPTLAAEYVLYSGHSDAHGIRNPIKNDSIYYGADDNGSVNVAMFAVARAFKLKPGKRPILFVIHGAEERGLLGSRWYSAHPTVPINNIIAVLNGDMIGRNNIDSAALLGVQSPHKNSSELVAMAMSANKEGPRFKLDTLWDKPAHPEGWYFRSDHLPYARLGIPALMYTTLLHPDYHTPSDNAENINYEKLKKMTDWLYRTGWKVANADKRPATDVGFKLER